MLTLASVRDNPQASSRQVVELSPSSSSKRSPIRDMLHQLIVFVFGSQDTMNEVSIDVPPSTDPSGGLSLLTIHSESHAVDVIITAPTPPIAGSGSSEQSQTTPNGTLPRNDLSGSLPGVTRTRASTSPKPRTLSPGPRITRAGRNKTITGVTEEARKVFEHLVKRSLSQNDTPSDVHSADLTEMEAIQEHNRTSDETKYQPTSIECGADDDGTSHSPVSGPNSLYSCSSRSSSYRNRIHQVKPFTDEKQFKEATSRQKQKKRMKSHRLVRKSSSSSTSSTEYEIVEGQLQLRKKSFIKSAKEHLAASFRRKKTSSGKTDFDPYHIDDDEIRQAEAEQPKGKHRKSFRISLKHHGSYRLRRAETDRCSPNGEVAVDGQRNVQSDGACSRHTENGAITHQGDEIDVVKEDRRGRSRKDIRSSKKDRRDKEKMKANHGIFMRLINHFRKGYDKLKRKSSHKGPQRASSVDAITFHSTTHPQDNAKCKRCPHERWGQGRPGGQPMDSGLCVDGPDSPPCSDLLQGLPYPPGLPPSGEGSAGGGSSRERGQFQLRELAQCLPGSPGSPGAAAGCAVHYQYDALEVTLPDGSRTQFVSHEEVRRILQLASEDRLDEIDSISPRLRRAAGKQDEVHKPFDQKTDQEKDEIYGKIAEQLASIADNYNLESPKSLKSPNIFFKAPPEMVSGSATPGKKSVNCPHLTVCIPSETTAARLEEASRCYGGGSTPIEQKIGKILRDKGDKVAVDLAGFSPVVGELVNNASYSKFQQIIHKNVGAEPGWQQVALLFNLTRSAVQLAGLGTAAALQIKENTLRYFEDRFAGWIIGQGGWESVVEDTDLSSEVD